MATRGSFGDDMVVDDSVNEGRGFRNVEASRARASPVLPTPINNTVLHTIFICVARQVGLFASTL